MIGSECGRRPGVPEAALGGSSAPQLWMVADPALNFLQWLLPLQSEEEVLAESSLIRSAKEHACMTLVCSSTSSPKVAQNPRPVLIRGQ